MVTLEGETDPLLIAEKDARQMVGVCLTCQVPSSFQERPAMELTSGAHSACHPVCHPPLPARQHVRGLEGPLRKRRAVTES